MAYFLIPELKQVEWVGSSQKNLGKFPEEVKEVFGYALYLAQNGEKHDDAKPLTGKQFPGASTLEVVENHKGDTYRAIYTVKFRNAVYVLHCFQKKSKSGIKTPQSDIDKVVTRLKLAKEHYKENYENRG